MDNLTLQRFDTEDGIEIVINLDTGESFATQSGYARMSGINVRTITRRVENLRNLSETQNALKVAQVQTAKGMRRGAVLIPEDTILEWLKEDNPDLLVQFAKLGLRMTMHKWAGLDDEMKLEKNIYDCIGEFASGEIPRIKGDNEVVAHSMFGDPLTAWDVRKSMREAELISNYLNQWLAFVAKNTIVEQDTEGNPLTIQNMIDRQDAILEALEELYPRDRAYQYNPETKPGY